MAEDHLFLDLERVPEEDGKEGAEAVTDGSSVQIFLLDDPAESESGQLVLEIQTVSVRRVQAETWALVNDNIHSAKVSDGITSSLVDEFLTEVVQVTENRTSAETSQQRLSAIVPTGFKSATVYSPRTSIKELW